MSSFTPKYNNLNLGYSYILQQVLAISEHWESLVDVAKTEKYIQGLDLHLLVLIVLVSFLFLFFIFCISPTVKLRKEKFLLLLLQFTVFGFSVTLESCGFKFGILVMCRHSY